MTARTRKNKTPPSTSRNQTIDQPTISIETNKDILQRLGLGSVQGWLFGIVAGLSAATFILNSDGLTKEGDNILIALAWSLLVSVLLFVRWYRKIPFYFDELPSTQQQSIGCWRWFDGVAAVFFSWVLVSFVAVWLSGNGVPRAMLTMLAHWCGFAAMFVVWRLLLNGRRMIRGMLLLFLALVIAETTTAYYDYCYLGPQRRADFRENPEQLLAENNTVSQGEQELLINRIESVEPLGTYSLTNSLAGVLAPWCVFLCGLVLLGCERSTDSPIEKQRRWQLAILVLLMIAYVGFILLITHSRSGVLATLFGIACLLLCMFAGKIRNKRLLYGTMLIATLAVIAGLTIGFASGKLSGMISEATKSFGYRIQYWQSSSQMIADHPIVGCGIGNFREYYTQYKLPTASESISDPHNLFYEIATNTGLPALACFIVLLVAAICYALKSKPNNGDDTSSDKPLDVLRESWRLYSPFVIGGFVGIVVAAAYSYTNCVIISTDVAGIALVGFLFGCAVFLPVISFVPLPLRTLAPICLVVLTVNLLAAGGISFPHVNVSFWFLIALCFCCANGTGMARLRFNHSAFVCVSLCFFGLTVALYPTAYLANLRANTLLRNMQSNPSQFVYIDKQITQFERIVKHDPWRTQTWCDLCSYYLIAQREFPALTPKRPDTSGWQGVIDEQLSKNRCSCPYGERELSLIVLDGKIADALVGAVKSSPLSTTMYAGLGAAFLDDYMKTQNHGSIVLATVMFELSAARYPNHAHAYANLAKCYYQLDDTTRQVANAKQAIELDDITPHSDRKLPAELRQMAEQLVVAQ